MISDPDFERVNFQHQMSKIMIVCRIDVTESTRRHCSYKLEENGVSASKIGALFEDVPDEDGVYTVGCCNSLILFSSKVNWKRLYVYDAMKHRQKLLPRTPFLESRDRCKSLVFDASTQKYKVVVLTYKIHGLLTQCCAYTLDCDRWCGDDSWRLIPLHEQTDEQSMEVMHVMHSIVFKGMLHWMIFDSHRKPFIQPMDIAKERFLGRIEFPHRLDSRGVLQVGKYDLLELRGSLCLMKATSDTDELIIWVLKDSNWDVRCRISLSSIAGDPTYWMLNNLIIHPRLVLESCNSKMTHILLDRGNALYWYDVDGKEMTRILIESDFNNQEMSYCCSPREVTMIN